MTPGQCLPLLGPAAAAADPSRQTGWPPRQATMWPPSPCKMCDPRRPFALLCRGEQRKRGGQNCAATLLARRAPSNYVTEEAQERTEKLTAAHPRRWWQCASSGCVTGSRWLTEFAAALFTAAPRSPRLHTDDADAGFSTLSYCQRSSKTHTECR